MRRNRWTAWWVMGWLALSLSVANASPLMSNGGALVCSASGTKWVESTDAKTSPAQSHTWHCSLCLPFVAGGESPAASVSLAAGASVAPPVEASVIRSRTTSVYSARAPPRLQPASELG